MTVYVLDSSALIRFLDKESGWFRVKSILRDCIERRVEVRISAIQWGEVAGNLRKRLGPSRQAEILASVLPSDATVVPATGECAVRAADIRMDRKLSYADAFALDLAMTSSDSVLVTADFGFKAVEDLARIEFLPAK
jgi:PIN domain nuclease of toxin-antitoxin system